MHALSLSYCSVLLLLFLASNLPASPAKPSAAHPPPPVVHRRSRHRQLAVDYYAKTCPQLEKLVGSVTSRQFREAPVSAPATIRLFFHDCFVEGCDGSVLVEREKTTSSSSSWWPTEREAEENKGLRREGFETVKKAKSLVETHCPSLVSCSDILAIAARDFIHLAGGPYYQVKKGRWDGKISKATNVPRNIPRSNSTVDQLIDLFSSKGLTAKDLVVLSGAHTIGYAHCREFLPRLYDFRGSRKPDPSLDPNLLKELKMSCPRFGGGPNVVMPLDVTTPFAFDNGYYSGLEKDMGLLGSDQALFLDPRTKDVVVEMARDKGKFFETFSEAMDRMGSIGVKRGARHGQIRTDCTTLL